MRPFVALETHVRGPRFLATFIKGQLFLLIHIIIFTAKNDRWRFIDVPRELAKQTAPNLQGVSHIIIFRHSIMLVISKRICHRPHSIRLNVDLWPASDRPSRYLSPGYRVVYNDVDESPCILQLSLLSPNLELVARDQCHWMDSIGPGPGRKMGPIYSIIIGFWYKLLRGPCNTLRQAKMPTWVVVAAGSLQKITCDLFIIRRQQVFCPLEPLKYWQYVHINKEQELFSTTSD
jgi:hypothetical protein